MPTEVPTEADATPVSPIVVFVHVHYLDVWNDMVSLLAERLNVPFRLVITSSLPQTEFQEPRTQYHRGTLVMNAENRGRDIRPFLLALGRVGDFEIGLKLHTKRSVHRLDGDDWRDEILSSLLPAPPGARTIVQAFTTHDRIGMVAPEGLLLPVRDWIMRNRRKMKRVSTALTNGPEPRTFSEGYFAAGSMFWFRREALAAFADPTLAPLFEEEQGQVDGTTAHAIERLFALKAEADGFVAMPMNALNAVQGALSADELWRLSRSRATVVSRVFQVPRIIRLLAHHTPWVLRLYRTLPLDFRRRLRQVVTGRRTGLPPS